jgi:hypothetical protein
MRAHCSHILPIDQVEIHPLEITAIFDHVPGSALSSPRLVLGGNVCHYFYPQN